MSTKLVNSAWSRCQIVYSVCLTNLTLPDFSALQQPKAWTWGFMFFIIASLESLLNAKAVDLIVPWKRKSSMDRVMVAVGAGNLRVTLIGGLPMISEIVRT